MSACCSMPGSLYMLYSRHNHSVELIVGSPKLRGAYLIIWGYYPDSYSDIQCPVCYSHLSLGTVASVPPFSLASSFPPIPAKLVSKIQSLQFMEMRELLPDNIAACADSTTVPNVRNDLRPKQREISSILTWVSAFVTYTAVVAAVHPDRVKDLLAYLRLIVREAQRTQGKGWLSYDHIFRQNAASNPALCWANLDTSLHSSFCVGSSSANDATRTVCAYCNEFDHSSEECVMAPVWLRHVLHQATTTIQLGPPT